MLSLECSILPPAVVCGSKLILVKIHIATRLFHGVSLPCMGLVIHVGMGCYEIDRVCQLWCLSRKVPTDQK